MKFNCAHSVCMCVCSRSHIDYVRLRYGHHLTSLAAAGRRFGRTNATFCRHVDSLESIFRSWPHRRKGAHGVNILSPWIERPALGHESSLNTNIFTKLLYSIFICRPQRRRRTQCQAQTTVFLIKFAYFEFRAASHPCYCVEMSSVCF